MEHEFDRQLEKIRKIDLEAQQEARILDRVNEERTTTLSTLVGEAWMAKTFPDKYASIIDPLLTKKFRTKASHSSIRLEKLLLELDKIDTLGNEELRAKRKEEVKYLQTLLKAADELNAKANRLVNFQDHLAKIGRFALIKTLDPSFKDESESKTDAKINGGERRFAQAPDTAATENIPRVESAMSIETPEPTPEHDHVASDNHEDLHAVQQDMDEKARQFYHNRKSHKGNRTGSKRRNQEPDVSMAQDTESEGTPMEKPSVQIKEMPRAYVMVIADPKIRMSRVSLDEEGDLNIVVPGKSPVKFELGPNINVRGITKEIQGDSMRLVLPKIPVVPMRTGRTFAEYPTFPRGWSRDDFWSRF